MFDYKSSAIHSAISYIGHRGGVDGATVVGDEDEEEEKDDDDDDDCDDDDDDSIRTENDHLQEQ